MIYKHLETYTVTNINTIVTFIKPCNDGFYTQSFKISTLPPGHIDKWIKGMDIKLAMPNLSQAEHDMFETGLTPQDVKDYFKDGIKV